MQSLQIEKQNVSRIFTPNVDWHQQSPLPIQRPRWIRWVSHPLAMPYNRLALLMALINTVVFFAMPNLELSFVTNMALANFAVGIFIRQQDVINVLFRIATAIPTSWPLALRWAAGKVYHFGGIHVGGFFSGTVWLGIFGFLLSQESSPTWLLGLVYLHLVVLVGMSVVALPKIRAKYHNTFEKVGRFGGWLSLFFFWVQTIALVNRPLWESPQFWVLLLVTFSIALPWIRLRKVPVQILTPSSHVALTNFAYGVTPFAGSSTDLSRNPLFEWHSFANVPTPGKEGFRLTISRAGDWTGALIDEVPSHLWVRGIPTAGVGNIETLFKRVVWIATGSGIGPCLPHLLKGKVPAKLVWSTRNPRKTYGDALVDEILEAQPDATIWDTDAHGKPDLVKLAFQAYKEFDAEAVICISNKKVTWHVNYQLESRGIPAFGAIWDS